MKSYPHIPREVFAMSGAYIFDKIDGNNLRFEYSRKRGWYKTGSRTQLIDDTHPMFGDAVRFFNEHLADSILSLFKRAPQHIVVFAEWAGPNSFCGIHQPGDDMDLSVFDITLDKRGFLHPREFVRLFDGYDHVVKFLGIHNYGQGLVDNVRAGTFSDDVTFEGVVAKGTRGKSQRIMAKAKSQAWIDRVQDHHDPRKAKEILSS